MGPREQRWRIQGTGEGKGGKGEMSDTQSGGRLKAPERPGKGEPAHPSGWKPTTPVVSPVEEGLHGARKKSQRGLGPGYMHVICRR